MTPSEITSELLHRFRKSASSIFSYAIDSPGQTFLTDNALEKSLNGTNPAAILEYFRSQERPHVVQGFADLLGTSRSLQAICPDSITDIVSKADDILDHRLVIFGRSIQLGHTINWQADPATGANWPDIHFSRVPIRLGNGSDIRVVWELNRLAHLTTLGQAYQLTGNESYTEEFLRQTASWYEQNPPRFGVNWKVAMEVAIRSVNLITAVELFRTSPLLDDAVMTLILKLVLSHARYIRSNLEFSQVVTSNHYLSDLIGLFVIGTIFPQFKASADWVNFSAAELVKEMRQQILPDGVDYEGSTGYHRYVLEIYLLFVTLCRQTRLTVPEDISDNLEAMFDFVRHYLKTDGTAPIIGDSDDGRLLQFSYRPAVDHSYLMSIAAILFRDGAFKRSSNPDSESLWWFGHEGAEIYAGLRAGQKEPVSKLYPDAQIAVQRAGPLYLIVDCGDHGAKGVGSHAHSDALSFELAAFNITLLRDPGTFVYTGSHAWRNKFRSTEYHNTVQVDSEEISGITEQHLFSLTENVRPRINKWESSPSHDLLDAEHYAYSRLHSPLTHRRIIRFNKTEGFWILGDEFICSNSAEEASHLFEFFFNFDSGIDVVLNDDDSVTATAESANLAIIPISGHRFESRIVKRWVSLNYGVRQPALGVVYRLYSAPRLRNSVLLIPYRPGDEERKARIISNIDVFSAEDSPYA